MSSAWTQTDLDALELAIAKGVKVVKYTDKEVTYRNLDEMLRIRSVIRQSLGLDGRSVRLYAKHSKGV